MAPPVVPPEMMLDADGNLNPNWTRPTTLPEGETQPEGDGAQDAAVQRNASGPRKSENLEGAMPSHRRSLPLRCRLGS